MGKNVFIIAVFCLGISNLKSNDIKFNEPKNSLINLIMKAKSNPNHPFLLTPVYIYDDSSKGIRFKGTIPSINKIELKLIECGNYVYFPFYKIKKRENLKNLLDHFEQLDEAFKIEFRELIFSLITLNDYACIGVLVIGSKNMDLIENLVARYLTKKALKLKENQGNPRERATKLICKL